MRDQKVPSPGRTWQWRIQGRPPPPLFLDETEALRVENIFFQTTPPPPLIGRSGSATALNRLYQLLKGKTIIMLPVYHCQGKGHTLCLREFNKVTRRGLTTSKSNTGTISTRG